MLGIPLPPIFVFEKDDANWGLIDGLQRLSTLLEFMGKLRVTDKDGTERIERPSILDATRYLPSLHNVVWEKTSQIPDVLRKQQNAFDKIQQLSIRRARIGVEILKRPSDDQTKFDLFQRLNAGHPANAEELRNCIMLMVNGAYFRSVKAAADNRVFKRVAGLTEDQIDRQRHMEYAVRFLVHAYVPYDGRLDVEEYIDEGIVSLAKASDGTKAKTLIIETFNILDEAEGKDGIRRFENGHHAGKVGLVGLEGIAVGVARNLSRINALADPIKFVRTKIRTFWNQPQTSTFTSPGVFAAPLEFRGQCPSVASGFGRE